MIIQSVKFTCVLYLFIYICPKNKKTDITVSLQRSWSFVNWILTLLSTNQYVALLVFQSGDLKPRSRLSTVGEIRNKNVIYRAARPAKGESQGRVSCFWLLRGAGCRLRPLMSFSYLLRQNWHRLQTVVSLQFTHQGSWILVPWLAHTVSCLFRVKHLFLFQNMYFSLCFGVPTIITCKISYLLPITHSYSTAVHNIHIFKLDLPILNHCRRHGVLGTNLV